MPWPHIVLYLAEAALGCAIGFGFFVFIMLIWEARQVIGEVLLLAIKAIYFNAWWLVCGCNAKRAKRILMIRKSRRYMKNKKYGLMFPLGSIIYNTEYEQHFYIIDYFDLPFAGQRKGYTVLVLTADKFGHDEVGTYKNIRGINARLLQASEWERLSEFLHVLIEHDIDTKAITFG